MECRLLECMPTSHVCTLSIWPSTYIVLLTLYSRDLEILYHAMWPPLISYRPKGLDF